MNRPPRETPRVKASAKPSSITPGTAVQYLKTVGEGRAAILHAAGLETVEDLLYFFPFRYEDRRHPVQVDQLRRIDAPVTLRGRIVSAGTKTSPVRRLRIFEAMFDDGSGSVMLVWFNQPYLSEQIKRGDRVAIYGQPRISNQGRLQFENPEFEKIDVDGETEDEGSIIPVYSSIATIKPKAMRRIVEQAMPAIAYLDDPLPDDIQKRLGVMELRGAVLRLHHPEALDHDFADHASAAHRRIILEEFFSFQLALRLRRAGEEVEKKDRLIGVNDAIREAVRSVLPFKLTGSQRRVVKEIADDLQSEKPMYRLLQGDVGSGKTIVALIGAMIEILNGHQVALLAPTELLVEQHFQRVSQLLEGQKITLAKSVGSANAAERRKLSAGLADGSIDLVIGTHALLEKSIRFKSLGFAIIDEQHRFGVEQRQRLFSKGKLPDILVMTATPIPRSLALAMFGDLELSVIDELPPGRQPIKTAVRGSSQLPKVLDFIEGEIKQGSQAYVVFPIIEESEKSDLKPLTVGFAMLQQKLPGVAMAMIHGRMSADEKEATMAQFKNGAISLLVSTTVIEVGIDVPNASVMLIVDADRFGLSQLHQLRGRVGRGERKSFCILIRDERASEISKERLKIFEATSSGFDVAEKDLTLRGAGDFLGTRQAGLPKFRFGDLLRDHALMDLARQVAIETLDRLGLAKTQQLMQALSPDLRARTASKD
ncbi:MAG TPA: ATP-dependent DNA helicase RecG [Thermoanaerobaculia bacterium]|nr:ATP-dependent DNA helicase RecG [Thermoanaerobaculia bacterium]